MLPSVGAALLMAIARPAFAVDVMLRLVVETKGVARPVSERQSLWWSPFGGFVAETAPFGLRLNDAPILEFLSASEKLLEESAEEQETVAAEAIVAELADDRQRVSAEDIGTFRFSRPSSAMVSLRPGRHALTPSGIEFTVKDDDTLSSTDARLRIDAARRTIDLVLHPVTIRATRAGRSHPTTIDVIADGRSLLQGLTPICDAFVQFTPEIPVPAAPTGAPASRPLLSTTLFLPASAPEGAYDIRWQDGDRGQTATFTVATDGTVAVRGDTASTDGRTITLPLSAAPRAATQSAAEWPHSILLHGAEGKPVHRIDTAVFWLKPGGEYRCRLSVAGRDGKATAETSLDAVRVVLQPALPDPTATAAATAAAGPPFVLTAQGGGVFSGRLSAGPGLQRMVSAGPWRTGQTLGFVLFAEEEPRAAVSLFTTNNRGLFRRGDGIDVFWTASPAAATPAALPVVLRGMGIEKQIGTTAGTSVSLRLDSSALAPGGYEVTVKTAGTVVYPARFRICQREPKSEYAIYSYVYGRARPVAGSPINAYYDGVQTAKEPGMRPFLGDVDAGLDPLLVAYATSPLAPAVEKCRPVPDEEAGMMVLAAQGAVAVPTMPYVIHHEDYNPKHSLPEELASVRRRLALFTQPRADVAGMAGLAVSWYGTLHGYWEESLPLDGHQAERNAVADAWIATQTAACRKDLEDSGVGGPELEKATARAGLVATSSVLPNAFAEYLADARAIRPDLTAHNSNPSWWLAGATAYPPAAYATLTHRDAVDYSDYGITAWGNFRAPAYLSMGNPLNQKTRCNFFTTGRPSRIASAFGAAGRGLDGISLALDHEHPAGEDAALLRIFERFGSLFTSLEPLADVAVYYGGRAYQESVILHDLARLRRPGMLLAPEDVVAGKLAGCRVLFLAGIGDGEPDDVLAAFRTFAENGGVILKDRTCAAGVPGRDIGFAYDDSQVHRVWGLAYADGEAEFAHLWKNFKATRERPLVEQFAKIPPLPVSTPTPDVVISPLAGKESILCFSINQTLVPLEVEGPWRQRAVLPRRSTLLVEEGWHVHDVLAGRSVALEKTPQGLGAPLDFTRCEGAIHLLTRRQPVSLAARTLRVAPHLLRVHAWLADAAGKPLPDPLPFEFTLRLPDGTPVHHVFAAASPTLSIDVPVPARSEKADLELAIHDLVLGCTASQPIVPADPAAVTGLDDADLVGGRGAITEFVANRKEPVTILLDEGQDSLRPAAERLAKMLRGRGRDARLVDFDPASVRPLPLRWRPTAEDEAVRKQVRDGGLAWRINLTSNMTDKKKTRVLFDDPRCGYAEYGPRLRFDGDIILFGLPETHRAVEDLAAFLRRSPSENLPGKPGFFIHPLKSPFQAGRDGLYVACRDEAGAAAAVARLESLRAADKEANSAGDGKDRAATPVDITGGMPSAGGIDDMIVGKFGTRVLDAAFTADGKRLFVTTDSYGDSLFLLDEAAAIVEQRPLGNRCGNNVWERGGGRLLDVAADSVLVTLGGAPCRYSLDRGWLCRAVPPPTGFTGRFSMPIAASTLLEDRAHGRVVLGGQGRIRSLDAAGKVVWAFDDTAVRTDTADMLHPRSLFPRGTTPDGRHLVAAGFGIKHDVYGRGAAVNESLVGLDAATGRLLWERRGMLVNQGKVVPLAGRFLVIDDAGAMNMIDAATGRDAGRLASVEGTDWILPAGDAVLVVENTAFDRTGATARAYLRPLAGGEDRVLAVAGRVTDVAVAADGSSITLATERGLTQRFAADGALVWSVGTPSGGIVRVRGDGGLVVVGGRDGVVHLLDAADGRSIKQVDLNPFNVTTGERFVAQSQIGDLPDDATLTPPSDSPEASWLKTLAQTPVKLGPNPAATQSLAGTFARAAEATVAVDKGATYVVELLAAAARPEKLSPHTRLEITVAMPGAAKGTRPFTARLPIGSQPARRRVAFRPPASGNATISLRAVEPQAQGAGSKATLSYAQTAESPAGLVVTEPVVAALGFPGRNVVLNGGPKAKTRPLGDLTCEVKPWTGGSSVVRWAPYPAPATALRLVDGIVGDQETIWTREVSGLDVESAEARIAFPKPQTLAAIVVYEDNAGPVATPSDVKETVSPHFGVFVREAKTKQWRRIGLRSGNVNLVNVFPCPDMPVDEVRYFAAPRNDADTTDGLVRLAEVEAYSADEIGIDEIDGLLEGGEGATDGDGLLEGLDP
jgi:hypothetical protein